MGLASDRERMREVVGLFMRGSHGGFGDIDAEGMASTMIMRKTMDTRGSASRKKIRRNGDNRFAGPMSHGPAEDA